MERPGHGGAQDLLAAREAASQQRQQCGAFGRAVLQHRELRGIALEEHSVQHAACGATHALVTMVCEPQQRRRKSNRVLHRRHHNGILGVGGAHEQQGLQHAQGEQRHHVGQTVERVVGRGGGGRRERGAACDGTGRRRAQPGLRDLVDSRCREKLEDARRAALGVKVAARCALELVVFGAGCAAKVDDGDAQGEHLCE